MPPVAFITWPTKNPINLSLPRFEFGDLGGMVRNHLIDRRPQSMQITHLLEAFALDDGGHVFAGLPRDRNDLLRAGTRNSLALRQPYDLGDMRRSDLALIKFDPSLVRKATQLARKPIRGRFRRGLIQKLDGLFEKNAITRDPVKTPASSTPSPARSCNGSAFVMEDREAFPRICSTHAGSIWIGIRSGSGK